MSDRLTVHADPALDIVTEQLATLAESLTDLRPAWAQLGKYLADTAQARWPLRRRSGRLRRSLTWTGQRLGRGGIFRSRPDRLTFGSRLFYSGFHQTGTRQQPARVLLHVDPADIAARLDAWAVERAKAAGLEVSA